MNCLRFHIIIFVFPILPKIRRPHSQRSTFTSLSLRRFSSWGRIKTKHMTKHMTTAAPSGPDTAYVGCLSAAQLSTKRLQLCYQQPVSRLIEAVQYDSARGVTRSLAAVGCEIRKWDN